MKAITLLVLFVLVEMSSFAADISTEPVLQLSGWTYGRERKTITGSNRVTGAVEVKNKSKSTVADVKLTLVYTTGLGEKVFEPIVKKIGSMRSGESQKITFVAELVPVFQGYTIAVDYDGRKKEEWYGNSDGAQPEFKLAPLKGQAGVVILGKEVNFDKSGKFAGTLHVKNEGQVEAKDVKFFITFFDFKKNKIKEWGGPLGSGVVPGGKEMKIPFSVPDAPKNYGGYSIKLNDQPEGPPEAALAGGDFAGMADVEFAHFKFTHLDSNKSGYKVEAQCRNGFKNSVNNVRLELVFFDGKHREIKRFKHEIKDSIKSQDIVDISFEIPGLPAYEEYEQKISYNQAEKTPVANQPQEVEAEWKFANMKEVDIVFGAAQTNEDQSVTIPGAVRNGKSHPVKEIVIHMVFAKAGGAVLAVEDYRLPQLLQPDEQKVFNMKINKAAGFSNYSFTFKFVNADADKKQDKSATDDALRNAL